MKKNYLILFLLPLLIFSEVQKVKAQNTLDSSFHTTEFAAPFHNIALLTAPKGKFYYKSIDIVHNSIGKNFGNKVEIDFGEIFVPIPLAISTVSVNLRIKCVIPISDNLLFGAGYSTVFLGSFPLEVLDFAKHEFFAGFTYNPQNNNLYSLNFNFGPYVNFADLDYIDWPSYSITYVYIHKFNKNWSLVSDNKLALLKVIYQAPDDYKNFNLYANENILSVRKREQNNLITFGLMYYVGVRKWKPIFIPLPYFSYTVSFGK